MGKGFGSGVRGRKVKSRDYALASDLARAILNRPPKYKQTNHDYIYDWICMMRCHFISMTIAWPF